ncbi:MAG: hypothetical protein ACLR3R_19900 [Clostridium paraputrificum]
MKKNKSTNSLQSLVNELELQLGMNVSVNGGSLKGLPLYDFLLIMQKSVKTSDGESLKKYAFHISTFCMRLSYFNDRFAFQNRNVLDFSFYDNADVLCSFFLQYQEHIDIKDFKNKELSTFIEYIKIMEQSNSGLQDVLSYRFIRLFLTLICMGFHVDASVICQFLRNQFWIYEGLNPRTKLSNEERTKLMNKVLRDRAKYSRRFKDKMSASIRKVNKTVSDTKDYVNSKAEDAEFEVASDNVEEPNVSDTFYNNPSDVFENITTPSPEKNEKPKVNYSSRKIVKSDSKSSEEKLKEEQEKLKREKEEQERLKREQEEKDRLAKEEAIAKEKAEKEKAEKERLEQERLAEEERKRNELEQAERDRLLKEKEEADRLKKESEELKRQKLEKLRAQKQKRELEKQERERREEQERLEKLAREKEESERRREQDRLAIQRERERIAEQKRLEQERQRQAELDRQKQRREELDRQRQLEQERQRQLELERLRRAELESKQQRTDIPQSPPRVKSNSRISVDRNNKKGLKNSSIF